MSAKRIFLIGPMGAGKTTLARHLSTALDVPCFDSDEVIVERTGADIPWIFDIEGEQGFRDRETQIIDELTQYEDIVLATGGGAVLREQNRQMLSSRGLVVFLDVSVTAQFRRIAHDKNRPLIQTADPMARLREMRKQRLPLYQSIADLTILTDNENISSAITKIRAAFEATQASI